LGLQARNWGILLHGGRKLLLGGYSALLMIRTGAVIVSASNKQLYIY